MNVRKFIKTIPMKLYLLLAAAVLFAFFSNDFGLVDIQKTAVILAAGIDRAGENFRMTAQLAVPKGTDRTTGGTSSVEIKTEGKTVSDCVTQIFTDTGWVPKLVFCNLVVLGEEAAKEDTVSYLNYFLRNEYMPDSCFLAVCEGTAEELITSQSALDDASSLAVSKLFSDAAEKSGYVMRNTLKDFAIGYYSVSESSFLPFLRTEVQDGAQSPSANNEPHESERKPKIYIAKETALFLRGKMVSLLSPEETLAYSLLHGKVSAGTFNAEKDKKPVTLTLLENEGSVGLDLKSGPVAVLKVSAVVRFCCSGTAAPIEEISSDRVDAETVKSATSVIENYLRRLWEKSEQSGCDLLGLKKTLFRASLQKYAAWKERIFLTPPRFEVEVTSMK